VAQVSPGPGPESVEPQSGGLVDVPGELPDQLIVPDLIPFDGVVSLPALDRNALSSGVEDVAPIAYQFERAVEWDRTDAQPIADAELPAWIGTQIGRFRMELIDANRSGSRGGSEVLGLGPGVDQVRQTAAAEWRRARLR
jgi:hypothetical protein